jgi:membrane protease YdiL (CAAX protease family)
VTVGTLEQAPGAPSAGPGFWWRVLSPPGAVLAAFAALVAAAGILSLAPLGDDALGAILAFGTSALLLAFGLVLWRGLPEHDRRLAVARPAALRPTILVGIGIGLLLLFMALVIVATGAAIDPTVERRLEEVEDIGTTPWQLVLMIIALVVLAPLGEELLFRALMLRALARRLAFWAAAVVSGACFAAAHVDSYLLWPRAVSLVLTGIGLAWLYRRRGYWAAVAAHATVNIVASIALVATATS